MQLNESIITFLLLALESCKNIHLVSLDSNDPNFFEYEFT